MSALSADSRRTHGASLSACVSELRRVTTRLLHAGTHRLRRLGRQGRLRHGSAVPQKVAEPGSGPGLMPVRLDDHAGADPGSERLVVVCAWCGRFRVGGTWQTAIDATGLQRASHGICPPCFAALEQAGCSETRG